MAYWLFMPYFADAQNEFVPSRAACLKDFAEIGFFSVNMQQYFPSSSLQYLSSRSSTSGGGTVEINLLAYTNPFVGYQVDDVMSTLSAVLLLDNIGASCNLCSVVIVPSLGCGRAAEYPPKHLMERRPWPRCTWGELVGLYFRIVQITRTVAAGRTGGCSGDLCPARLLVV